MVKLDKDDMTIVESLNEDEARAFILFLFSERRRHIKDIELIDERVGEVCRKFNWDYRYYPIDSKEGEVCSSVI